ncbi:MAG: MBL fold metallo-hydrolase [Deltaproteobacteria bacterium]|nr:MBL fold metallo-hydrolase [Deltaproteobacteria bacterium]
MREILSGIFTWPWFSEPHGYNFNGYLIRHAAGNLCIDPVEPTAEDLEEIARTGVGRILLTNRNHSRAANRVRSLTGARTAIHPDDAPHARNQGTDLDDELKLGEKVGPLVVVGVPGKSTGEVAFHWPERKILIVGDAVIGKPPGGCGLLPDRVVDDPPRLRASVKGLLALDFDVLLPGDGAPILQGAKSRLKELVDTFAP